MKRTVILIASVLIILLSPMTLQDSDASSELLSIGLYQEGTVDTPLSGPLIDGRIPVSTDTTSSGVTYKVPAGTVLSQNRGYLKLSGDVSVCSLTISISPSSISDSIIGQTGLRISLVSDSGTNSVVLDQVNGFSSAIPSISVGETHHITVTTAVAYSSGNVPSEHVGMNIIFSAGSTDIIRISFDPNGGTTDVPSKDVVVGGAYGDLPTPTRSGYIFDGWFTQPSGGDRITSASTVTLS